MIDDESLRQFEPGTEVVIGIDEAGRGPVLGPMVYAAFMCPLSVIPELKSDYGFGDSKQLTDARRRLLFEKIKSHPKKMAYLTRVLGPEELSREMLRRHRVNLNTLSHEAAATLVKQVIARGDVKVKKLEVDTVGDPHRYCKYLESLFSDVTVSVEPIADST